MLQINAYIHALDIKTNDISRKERDEVIPLVLLQREKENNLCAKVGGNIFRLTVHSVLRLLSFHCFHVCLLFTSEPLI